MTEQAKQAAKFIQQQASGLKPKIGITLGSGAGPVAEQVQDAIKISYQDIPGIITGNVEGHANRLVIGKLNNIPVACLQGKVHFYEDPAQLTMKTLIRSLKLIGCEAILLISAVGSLRKKNPPGSLMLVTDHINMQAGNPLLGENDDEFGPRFVALDNAYDLELRKKMLATAKKLKIKLSEGTFACVSGPCFETPAEIKAMQILGADIAGMSTIPEVIIARHCDLKVVTIAVLTNYGAGMTGTSLTHEGTLAGAKLATEYLTKLIVEFVTKI